MFEYLLKSNIRLYIIHFLQFFHKQKLRHTIRDVAKDK